MEISSLSFEVPEKDEEERENNYRDKVFGLFNHNTLRMSTNSNPRSVITSSIIVKSKAILVDGKIQIVEESFISYSEDSTDSTNITKLRPLVLIKGCNQKVL